MKTMRLKPGYGFYDLRFYPIGGDFHRTGSTGLVIDIDSIKRFKNCYGCNATAIKPDTQTQIAFNEEYLEEVTY